MSEGMTSLFQQAAPSPFGPPLVATDILSRQTMDIIKLIISFLSALDRLQLSMVSRRFRSAVEDEEYWRSLLRPVKAEQPNFLTSYRIAYAAWLRGVAWTRRRGGVDALEKISIFGAPGTGKDAVCCALAGSAFPQNYTPTVGVDFQTKLIQQRARRVKFQLWNLSGNPVFDSVGDGYMRSTFAGLFVYTADQPVTYRHLEPLERWFRQVSDKNPLVLLRNKCDIEHCEFEGNVAIVTQFTMELAAKYHHTGEIINVDISAKTLQGVAPLLDMLADLLEDHFDPICTRSRALLREVDARISRLPRLPPLRPPAEHKKNDEAPRPWYYKFWS